MARRLGVSREDVVAAAVRVCDRDGLDGLTVAAVAAEVGCRPPSVYHHVDGLDGLVRSVAVVAADHLTEQLEGADRDASGADALRAMVGTARRWGVAHPGRYAALCRRVDPAADPDLAAMRAAVLLPAQDRLAQLGVPPDERPPLLAALVAAVRGCIAQDLAAPSVPADDPADDAPPPGAARAAGHQLLVELLLDHVDAIRPTVAP